MIKTYFLAFVELFIISTALAQFKPAKTYIGVPKTSLHTNAIIRYDHTKYTLESKKRLVVNREYAISILDNEGSFHATVVLPYDDLSKITAASLVVYDQLGQKINGARMNDFEDIPYTASNLFDDLRLKYYEALQKKLPITIYVSTEKIYTDFFQLPTWMPQKSNDVLVQKATLKIENHSDLPYRFYTQNLVDSTLEFKDNGTEKIWTISNLKAFEKESYGPDKSDQLPRISFPLDAFQMEGFEGSFQSWETMAKFDLLLKKGLQELEPQTLVYIKKLTDTITDQKEKAKAIYQWMQKETRYESVQLGIGGWKPFSAKFVDEKKYGDCKALSNYTQALMSAAGIEAYYTSIQAGSIDVPIDPQKVYNQFNHIILCLPFDGDTTWLECTSNSTPFGYLGDFTDDRYALIAKEGESRLVKTPKYTSEDNLLNRQSHIQVNEEGGFIGELKAAYHNIQSEKRWFQKDENLRDQMDHLYQMVDVKGFNILNLDYEFIDDSHTIVYEKVNFDARQVARVTTTKMLLPLYYLNKKPKKIKNDEERRFDIVLKRGYTTQDTIAYQIPASYQIASLPEPISIESDFGSYESKIWKEDQKIYLYRKEIQNDGRFPPERWNEFAEYKNAIRKADKATAVLERVIP
jgi:hypothetical protein